MRETEEEEAGEVDDESSAPEEEVEEEERDREREDLVEESEEEEGCWDELVASAEEEGAFVLLEPPVTAVGSGIFPVKLAAAFQFVLVGAGIVASWTPVPEPPEPLTTLMLSV